jgi:hypothetical protein
VSDSDEDLWAGSGWDDDPNGPPPPPIPLDLDSASKPGPFPTSALPPVFRTMVRAVAANKQVPEEVPAFFGFGAVATLTGPRIAVTRGNGWTEPTNGYLLVIQDSGTGKTPAASDVIKPLRTVQKRMKADHVERINLKLDELDTQRGAILRNDTAGKRLEAEIEETKALLRQPPRIVVGSDSTPEALAEFMSRNNGHASILDAEGDFFQVLAGRYNKQTNIGLVLKGYDGDPYEVSRIARAQDDIERAILTLTLGVQPHVVEEAVKNRAMVDRGFLARFMAAWPPSLLGLREPDGEPYDFEALQAWAAALMRIYELPVIDQHSDDIPVLRLSAPARKRHVDYCQWIERRLHPDDGDLGVLPGWASKHKGRALRVAAWLHLVHGFGMDDLITEKAMASAIEICQWAVPHALAMFGAALTVEADDDSRCREVIEWIRRARPTVFTPREARRGVRKNWVDRETMAAVLDRLASLGHVSPRELKDRSGRRCQVFVPHPALLQQPDLETAA